MPRWFVQLTGDDPKGPYETEEIADRVVAGALPRDAPVCPEGDERYFPLETLPEFVSALKEASGRPPRPRSNPPRDGTTAPRSFRPPSLDELVAAQKPRSDPPPPDRPGLALGAIACNAFACLFWGVVLAWEAWGIARGAEGSFGLLALVLVIAGRATTTYAVFAGKAWGLAASLGSSLAGALLTIPLAALVSSRILGVFPVELLAAVLTYLARDTLRARHDR